MTSPLHLEIPPLSPTVTDSCDLLIPIPSLPATRTPSPIPDNWLVPKSVRIFPVSILQPSHLQTTAMVMLNGLAEASNLPLLFPMVVQAPLVTNLMGNAGPMMVTPSGKSRIRKNLNPKSLTTYSHKCNLCKSAFISRKNLHTHHCKMYTAGNICLLCHTFIPENALPKLHLQIVHNIQKPMTCGCCAWTFKDQSSVLRHAQWLKRKLTLAPGPVVINNCKPGTFATMVDKDAQNCLAIWQANIQKNVLSTSLPIPTIPVPIQPSVNKSSLNISDLSLVNALNTSALMPFSQPSTSSSSISAPSVPGPQRRGNQTGFLIKNLL